MATELPLKQMIVREKLAAMEALWEDLSRTPEEIASPGWHRDVLESRQKRVAEGKARYADWETAKAKIRRKVS